MDMLKHPLFSKVTILGLGMIGGSLAQALKQRGVASEVCGWSRRQSTLDTGLSNGVVDSATLSMNEALAGADIAVICAPVALTEKILTDIEPLLSNNLIITDAGSVKGTVERAARKVLGERVAQFVPGHPIAGSEQSGVAAANPNLYCDHKVILTPLTENPDEVVQRVASMWQAVGAQVMTMQPDHHDQVLAATSHLPHLLAYALVNALARDEESQDIFRYAAGGFRDFTRIASSDPLMWRDIFLTNKVQVLNVLGKYQQQLAELSGAIENSDGEALLGVFSRAKTAREHFLAINQRSSYTAASHTKEGSQVQYKTHKGGPVTGEIRVPGDKSISHRSIMLGSLAQGTTQVSGFLEGEDALATLQAFRDMGVVIEGPKAGQVTIHGVGMSGLRPATADLYMGNSGTSMRLLAGILAAQPFTSRLTGDASLSKRPMERVAKPLRLMGASISTAEGGRPPMQLEQGEPLQAIHYDLPVASAQVKSCVLLAGLFAEGETCVTEPATTRDHTERMLRGFGYPVTTQGNRISLLGGGSLQATNIDVPADISSAAFFMVAASIVPGSDLLLQHVGVNPTRTGVIDILRLMGADITLQNERESGGEPVADIRIRYAPLRGIAIPEELVPLAIDEFPVLFVAAVNASGKTVLTGAEELRVKESDRIEVMAQGLSAIGAQAITRPDGIEIIGAKVSGGEVYAHGDHRIAMAFAVAGLCCDGEIIINDCANVATSFPGFVELAQSTGFGLTVTEAV